MVGLAYLFHIPCLRRKSGVRRRDGACKRGQEGGVEGVLKEASARKQPFCRTCTYPKKASSFFVVPLASTSFSFLPSCRVPYDIPPCRTHPPPSPLARRGEGGTRSDRAQRKGTEHGRNPSSKRPGGVHLHRCPCVHTTGAAQMDGGHTKAKGSRRSR